MLPPAVRRARHQAARILGIALAEYEATALTLDDDTILPKYSHYCWPNPDGTPAENRARLGLALASSGWVVVHLLRPWVALLFKRRQARA